MTSKEACFGNFCGKVFGILIWDIRRISTRRNDQKIATKLFRHKTIFNFHMNNFGTIVENKVDFFIINSKVITSNNAKGRLSGWMI